MNVQIGVVVPTYDDYGNAGVIRRLIGDAERLGYDSVWFGDHLIVPGYAIRQTDPHWYEALSCAILGLGLTHRLSFGMDVLVAPYRNPILLAKMAATASELSSGRLMLGLGVGFLKGEFEALGAPFARRGSMTDEYLKVLRLLFEGRGPLSHHGEWVRFDDMYFGPVLRGRRPCWSAATTSVQSSAPRGWVMVGTRCSLRPSSTLEGAHVSIRSENARD